MNNETTTIECPMCESVQSATRVEGEEQYSVRNEQVTLRVPRLVCSNCGEAVVDPSFGDPSIQIYNVYRNRHGLLLPEEILANRKKYNLSQRAYSTLLGMSQATIARYESGSLQDKAYDELLRAAADPGHMQDILNRQGHLISDTERLNANLAIRSLLEQTSQQINEANVTYNSVTTQSINIVAYAAIVRKLAASMKPIPETKLNKLLFYVDFLCYQFRGNSITGCTYLKFKHGPVPKNYPSIHREIQQYGYVETEECDFGNGISVYVYIPGEVEPAYTFSEDELAVIEFVSSTFSNYTATKIRSYSHKEKAWIDTPDKQTIDYAYANNLSLRFTKR